MKLNVTLTEAHSYIRHALNLPPNAEIVIGEEVPGEFAILEKMVRDIDGMNYGGDQKISAIKRYRDTCFCGLADAKHAIEHWNYVRTWILQNRRAPSSYGDSFSFTLS